MILFPILIFLGAFGFIGMVARTLFFSKYKKLNKASEFELFLSPKHFLGEAFLLSGSFLLLSLVVLLNYYFGQPIDINHMILLVGAILVGLACYFRSFVVGLLGVCLIFGWMSVRMSDWASEYMQFQDRIKDVSFIGFTGLFFVGLYLGGILLEKMSKMQRWGFWYKFLGVVGIIVNFYLVYSLGERNPFSLFYGDSLYNDNRILTLYSLVLVVVFSLMTWLYHKKTMPMKEWLSICGIVIWFVILSFFPAIGKENLAFDTRGLPILTGGELFWILFFDALIFGICLWSIFIGILRGRAWMINLAILFILVFTIDLYFSWFIKFLDKSLFFIVTGLCFLLIGFCMERARRYLLHKIKTS